MSARGWTAIAVMLLLATAAIAGWLLAPGLGWLAVIVLLIALIMLLGKITTGTALGALINERNRMSLSRFQLLVWTVIIASAYFEIALIRVRHGDVAEPLVIGVGWQIWVLLGISTTSLVGTPLLNNNKAAKADSRNPAPQAGLVAQATTPGSALRRPFLAMNADRGTAQFTDLFQGDEAASKELLDVGKLQLFVFTAIVAIAYGVQLYQLIAGNALTDDVSLPALNEGLLTLMGISHAGYLGTKGVTQTP